MLPLYADILSNISYAFPLCRACVLKVYLASEVSFPHMLTIYGSILAFNTIYSKTSAHFENKRLCIWQDSKVFWHYICYIFCYFCPEYFDNVFATNFRLLSEMRSDILSSIYFRNLRYTNFIILFDLYFNILVRIVVDYLIGICSAIFAYFFFNVPTQFFLEKMPDYSLAFYLPYVFLFYLLCTFRFMPKYILSRYPFFLCPTYTGAFTLVWILSMHLPLVPGISCRFLPAI